MKTIYIKYRESRRGGEPLSDEQWSDREDEHIEFSIDSCSFEEIGFESVSVEGINKGDYINIIVVRYQTGDTFGCSHGYWHIEGGYKDYKEAERIVESIKDGTYGTGYIPWKGYFESLEDVYITTKVVS